MMLIHAYRQGGFMSNKKLGSSPIREKEKEGRVLKYFQVENGAMSFMELRER